MNLNKNKNKYFSNHAPHLLSNIFIQRKRIPHNQIYIVSPFLQTDFLNRKHTYGRIIDNFIEDGAKVTLLTRFNVEDINLYKDLEFRNFEIRFLNQLHAKIYIFLTNSTHPHYLSESPSLALIGSANFTENGFSNNKNYEICYNIGEDEINNLINFTSKLIYKSLDFKRSFKFLKKGKNE